MRSVRPRLRGFALLVELAFSADRRGATLAFSPIFPVMAGVSFAAMRVLITAVIHHDTSETIAAGVVFGVALCISVTLGRIGNTARLHVGEAMGRELERRLIGIVLTAPDLAAFDDPTTQDDLEVLRTEREAIVGAPRMLGWIVDGTGGLLVSFALLLTVNPILGLLLLAGVPTFVLNGWAENRINAVVQAEAETSRRAGHFFELATTAGPAKEIRTAGLADEVVRRYHELWRTADQHLFRPELRIVLVRMVGACIALTAFGAALGVLVLGVGDRSVGAGDIFVVLGVMTLVLNQLIGASSGLRSVRQSVNVALRAVDLADRARVAEKDQAALPFELELDPAAGIELRDVSFTYPEARKPAVDQVNLRFAPGSVVALVGENGAGKSTLVKLLFGLYRPSEGQVLVGGVDLWSRQLTSWRQRMSTCFQDYAQFHLLLREVVGVGDLAHLDDGGHVSRAIDRASASDVVHQLPDGLDSQLGMTFGGSDLSGGQWQKLAIARAFMRDGPVLLGLDEPTSALDPLAEHELFERYAENARRLAESTGGITVLVSHRFSTVRLANQIVVMDEGQVKEHGTHAELMNRNGHYAELYSLQARQFTDG